jgi:hypothetical protein
MAGIAGRFAVATARASTSTTAASLSTTNLLRAYRALPTFQQASIARHVLSSLHVSSTTSAVRSYVTAATTRKATTTRKTVKKTSTVAAKKKAAPKKKKVLAKKPKKKKVAVKKVLTPKEKQTKKVKELRQMLLKPPKNLPQTAWTVYIAKHNKTVPIDPTLAPQFKSLTAYDREVGVARKLIEAG